MTADDSGIVIAIEDSARYSGGIEGDHLVSLGESQITTGSNAWKSEHLRKMLELKPGDEVKLVWIHPGAGRMEGKVRCAKKPPEPLKLTDVCGEVRTEMERSRGQGEVTHPMPQRGVGVVPS